MTYRLKIAKPVVIIALMFIFALGIELGFLLDFIESDRKVQQHRRSLEETANELIPR